MKFLSCVQSSYSAVFTLARREHSPRVGDVGCAAALQRALQNVAFRTLVPDGGAKLDCLKWWRRPW